MKQKSKMNKTKEFVYGVISEVSFFAFLYYVQYLFGVLGNLFLNSLVLWVLVNLSITFCPVVRRCYK